jgi:hypothetical protein
MITEELGRTKDRVRFEMRVTQDWLDLLDKLKGADTRTGLVKRLVEEAAGDLLGLEVERLVGAGEFHSKSLARKYLVESEWKP